MNLRLRRVRFTNFGQGTRATVTLKCEAFETFADVGPAEHRLGFIKVNDQFPVTVTPLSTSPGYQNFRMYSQMYKYFRVRMMRANVDIWSTTNPTEAAPDAFSVWAVPYDPEAIAYNPDSDTEFIITETPGAKVAHFPASAANCRKCRMKWRVSPAAILGMTESEYVASKDTAGIGLGMETPNGPASPYTAPVRIPRIATLFKNFSNVARTYVQRSRLTIRVDFFDALFPFTRN